MITQVIAMFVPFLLHLHLLCFFFIVVVFILCMEGILKKKKKKKEKPLNLPSSDLNYLIWDS